MEQRCTQVLMSPIHRDVLLGQSLLTATCLSLIISSECADVAIRHDLPSVHRKQTVPHVGRTAWVSICHQTYRLSSLCAGNGSSPECRGESVLHRPMVRSSQASWLLEAA
ncbi:unnamed protein product [Rangifer tarandus platyrhynchus]|uniref:Uncharacterized protein n=1 Tax=Rangifer tarandus platyrhynchus TaxID=3082113 RepID=A0AC60A641_RANTA